MSPRHRPLLAHLALLATILFVATSVHAASLFPSVAVDSVGDVGRYTSLARISSNPAIAYYDATNGDLKYAWAGNGNTTGATWPAANIKALDSTGDVGLYASLAVVNGRPAIAYYDATNGDLKYVRANDTDGVSWGQPLTVASTGDVGQYASLAMVNNNPAIAYYDATNGDLKFIRSTDDGLTVAGWGTAKTLDGDGNTNPNVGLHVSLTTINGGDPAISYYDATNGDLKYLRSKDSSGNAWKTPATLDSAGDVGRYTSLEMINGLPAISYYDVTNGDLKYIRATNNSQGGNDSANNWTSAQAVTVMSEGDVGLYTSLEPVVNQPAISFHDATNGDLRYVRAYDLNGNVWGANYIYDPDGITGLYTSMTVVSGNPGISYYDATNGNLMFTRASTPTSVTLTGLTASRTGVSITLGWGAATELNVAGYHILRSETGARSDARQVTAELITAEGDGITSATYRWVDAQAPQGATYWIGVVKSDGEIEEHGPIRGDATVDANQRVFLPLLLR